MFCSLTPDITPEITPDSEDEIDFEIALLKVMEAENIVDAVEQILKFQLSKKMMVKNI